LNFDQEKENGCTKVGNDLFSVQLISFLSSAID
jgi:hypothetical protein